MLQLCFRLCAVWIWKDKKTKSLMEVETMIVPGLVFGNGILVEANPILKKHCLEHTDAETSLKFLSAILSSRIYECEFVQRRDLVPAPAFSRACSSSPEEVEILLNREHVSTNILIVYLLFLMLLSFIVVLGS